ncbi:MAG: S8 family serine peptidase, partial [Planctomycetota bacterium]|nr:S8 family serine peptidase [Planctomycetota bacterium]
MLLLGGVLLRFGWTSAVPPGPAAKVSADAASPLAVDKSGPKAGEGRSASSPPAVPASQPKFASAPVVQRPSLTARPLPPAFERPRFVPPSAGPAVAAEPELSPGQLDYDRYYIEIGGHRAHPTRLLGRFKDGTTAAQRGETLAPHELRVQPTDGRLPGVDVLESTHGLSAAIADTAEARQRGEAVAGRIRQLLDSGRFDYVEPDYLLEAARVPADEAFASGKLWGLANRGQSGGVAGVDVDAVRAWDITTGDPAVIVAVLDTGIRMTHQDLAGQLWTNPGEIPGNGIDDDAAGFVDDVHGMNAITDGGDPTDDAGHGTYVAGTIAASGDGGGPMVGVAWRTQIMACKFLNARGTGAVSDAIKGLNFAIRHGARIVNASFGGGDASEAFLEALQRARSARILFVASAGNDGSDNDRFPSFPACYPVDNVVAVAALDRSGALAPFSNHGIATVPLAAPGVEVLSCLHRSDNDYASWAGTS